MQVHWYIVEIHTACSLPLSVGHQVKPAYPAAMRIRRIGEPKGVRPFIYSFRCDIKKI